MVAVRSRYCYNQYLQTMKTPYHKHKRLGLGLGLGLELKLWVSED
jgi:C4-dicarboxylate-specific signal transduction histidine kinase